MSVFLYTAPVFAAIGLHLFVAREQFDRRPWVGVAPNFAGWSSHWHRAHRSRPRYCSAMLWAWRPAFHFIGRHDDRVA